MVPLYCRFGFNFKRGCFEKNSCKIFVFGCSFPHWMPQKCFRTNLILTLINSAMFWMKIKAKIKSHITFCRWISNKKSEIDLIKIVLSEDSNSHVKTAKSWIWAMIKLTEIITKHTMAARKSCSPTDLKLFNFIFTIDECELTTRSIRCYCHFLLFIYFQIELIEFKRQKSEALVKNGSIKCVNLFLNAMC